MIQTLHHASGIGLTQHIDLPFGQSIEQMVMTVHGGFAGVVAYVKAPAGHPVEWIEVPRAMWRYMRPKIGGVVKFGYRLGKNVLRTVFAVVASIIVSVIAPFLAPIVGKLAAGLIAAGVGIGASVAINALFPASSTAAPAAAVQSIAEPPQERARQFSNVESDSNILAKEAYLPVVVGTRRISPPEIASPFLYLDGGVQTIDRIFALDGHHAISDIQVDSVPVDDYASITTETKDGAEATGTATFVTKVTKFTQIGETLSTFSVDATDLVDQEMPSNSEPRWVRFPTVYDAKMEEISIRLQIDSFMRTDSATQSIRVPIRLRFRPKGSDGDWWNLPEIHIVGRDISTSLKEVRIRWDDQFGGSDTGGSLAWEFFQRVPASGYALSDGSTGDQWQAESHFVADTGLTDVANIQGRRNGLRVTLNEDDFPKGEYEWEIVRGIAMDSGALTTSTYVLSGAVNSLFLARNSSAKWQIPIDQGAYVGRVSPAHVTTIVNRTPCQRPSTALIGLRAKGQSVRNVTALVGRYVYDWDGSGWNTLTTTSNPASHFRQVLADYLTYHGINLSRINNDQLVAWRQECIDRGYEVSGVFAGQGVRETLEAIATAGYARPRFSDGYGVDWFRDRSAERPVQTFSPRNASSIAMQWVGGEKPVGIRAKFANEDDDYRDDELQLNNPFYTNFTGYEVKEYPTITNPELVRRRAYFDMAQAYYQGRRAWKVDAAIEGMICERGNLVGIVTDLIDDTNSGARIREMIDSATFTIDQLIPAESTTEIFSVPNIFDPEDIFTVGEQSVCLMTTPNGTHMATIVAAEDNIIRIEEPIDNQPESGVAFDLSDLNGVHIVLGAVSRFTSRCIVSDVQRTSEERATLICVDEAPEIYDEISRRFGA